MKPGRPLTDAQARARLRAIAKLEVRLTAKVDALNAKRAAARREADVLAAQLAGQASASAGVDAADDTRVFARRATRQVFTPRPSVCVCSGT